MNLQDKIAALRQLGLPIDDQPAAPVHRDSFTLRNQVLEHPRFTATVREIARLHARGREAKVAEGLLIVAQPGSGKTTVLEFYEGFFPRYFTDTGWKIPALRVLTPESPTVSSLAEEMQIALFDPTHAKGTTPTRTRKIKHLVNQSGVEIILLDEFQHFFDGFHRTESKRVSDWLKNLIAQIKIPIVLTGLPRSISVLNSNPQLRRRFAAPYYMAPFEFETIEQQLELRGVLKALEEQLPVKAPKLSEANMARRFYYASHGIFDYIIKILDEAVSRGGSDPEGALTMADFAAAFKSSIWRDAPDALNPFNVGASLRHLDKPGEPFDIWDDLSQYLASSVKPRAKRAARKSK
jgi:hypothetical protein